MPERKPVMELDTRFSSPGSAPTPWTEARERLVTAEVYWLSTVRPDGRPHVTPMVAVWFDGALYFSTGPTERKARNLEGNLHCVVTTGRNVLEGLDVVLEGEAIAVHDEARLQRVADAFASKYDEPFHFTVHDGAFASGGGKALVFEVEPIKAFGFAKGDVFSQTRWRF
jgi:hypothetical protein